ncbi:hypothetical protein FAC79_06320 [Campylobacter lari]|nr:hypothetical protein [Campylobacter lari]
MMNYEQRLNQFKKIYPEILELSLAEKSPFGELKKILDDSIKNDVIKNEEQFKTLANALSLVGQSIVAQSQVTSLNMILQGDENEVNFYANELKKAQTETEKAQTDLVVRQTKQIDDDIELKEQGLNIERNISIEKINLLKAQTETEKKKPALIDRQRKQIDDMLRIEAAKVAQGYSFGLSAGGLEIPKELEAWVREKIENIDK